MVLVAVSVCLATIVLNLHYRSEYQYPRNTLSLSVLNNDCDCRKPSTHRMPTWVRNILIQKMPGILMMRVPKQVVKGGFGARRSKYLRQADPTFAGLAELFKPLLSNLTSEPLTQS